MTRTIEYVGVLKVTSCWCGIQMAIPSDLFSIATRQEDFTVWCPLGHKFVYGDTTEGRLKEERRRRKEAERAKTATRELLEFEQRSHAATRGHVTRKKKQLARVSAGVCPCCNRSFANLARHMAGKHPDFTP
jgi:hypothetical protein